MSEEAHIPLDTDEQPDQKKACDEGRKELMLRRLILAIHNDPNLSPSHKARQIQQLMVPGKLHKSLGLADPERNVSLASLEGSIAKCLDHLDEEDSAQIHIEAADFDQTFHSLGDAEEGSVLGCKHYKVNCKFMAECCKKWFPCRFCHNEASDHEVDRYTTRYCLCMACDTVQKAGKTCVNPLCAKPLAHYYCNTCKFWDNEPEKKIFHCEKCNVCRLGSPSNFVHCDKCNACLANDYHKTHKCIERSLECDCPICGEFLFTTISPVIFMPCGHGIHFLCHREHLQSSYQCPICLKSVTDMSHFFNQIDLMLTNHEMPAEYSSVRSMVLCNDCEMKSTAKFHFVYHKCSFCKSYNTKVLRTFNEDEEAISEPSDDTDQSGIASD